MLVRIAEVSVALNRCEMVKNEKSKEEQERLVEGKWKEGEGGSKVRSLSRVVVSGAWQLPPVLLNRGNIKFRPISGKGISRYKPPRTLMRFENREEGEKESEKNPKTWHDRIDNETRHQFFE